MSASSTPSRRASGFGVVLAVCASCATYVDEPPLRSSGAAGSAGSAATEAGASASAGSDSAPLAGSSGTGGAGGQHSAGGQNQDGGAPAAGAGTAGSGTAGGGASSGSGAGGVAGKGGSGGGGGNGGAAGKASGGGGAGGSAGAPTVATCAKNPIPAKGSWNVTASHSHTNGVDPVGNAKDGVLTNRWTSAKDQAGDEWLQVDFGVPVTLTALTLVLGASPDDYPRKYAVRLSGSSQNAGAPVLASGMGTQASDTVVSLPVGSVGRYLLISQGGTATALWWSVAEIQASCAD